MSTNNESSNEQELKRLNNNLNPVGLRNSLHGNIYQLKILMLFLQTALDENYTFELYSEEQDAGKFDDVIFKYDKDNNEQYCLLQAKHRLKDNKIAYNELYINSSNHINDKSPFSLEKYFNSFRMFEQNPKYKNKLKDIIIYTNADFNNNIKNKCEVIEKKSDNILNNGEQYQFIFEKNNDIVKKLQDTDLTPELRKLAKELAKNVVNEDNSLDIYNEVFIAYKDSLEEEIFERNNEFYTFKKKFIKNKKNLSNKAKLFRKALKIEFFNLKTGKDLWKIADKKKFITNGKTKVVRKISECQRKQLPSNLVIKAEIIRFFKKLIFAVNQPNEEELGQLIKKKILDSFNNFQDQQGVAKSEIIYNDVQMKMLDWLKSPNSTPLSNKNNFFTQANERLNNLMSYTFVEDYSKFIYSYIAELKINFKSKIIKNIKEFIDDKDSNFKILNLISSEKDIYLSQAKIYQITKQLGWPLNTLLTLERLENQRVRVFECNLLVIVCENESKIMDEDKKELYNKLMNFVNNNEDKKIILITQENSILASFFKENNLKSMYEELPDITKVTDLDKTYLKNFLQKEIIFQNEYKKLADLIDIENTKLDNNELLEKEIDKLEKIITSETLSEFILIDTNIVVSNKASFTDSNSPYYDPYHIDISCTFNHQIINKNLLKNCIMEKKEDIFAFSSVVENDINILKPDKESKIIVFDETGNISDEDISKERFFILSDKDPKRNFQKLFANNKKNVHWLKCINNDKFIVEYSNRLCNLRDFLKIKVIEIEDFKEEIENNSIVIIVGDAGVGKSTILTTYFQKFDTFSWPIRINLKDSQKYLKNTNFNNFENIIEFLCQCDSVVGLETTLAKNLLKYYLKYSNQFILLLDGFDEINDNCQEKIIQLLKFFKNKKQKVWLTSRNKYKIENALGTFAFSYSLNPFDKKMQEDFIQQYWNKKQNIEKLDQKENHDIDTFLKERFKKFYELGFMKENDLMKIVLQTRMVIDIFYAEYKLDIRINNISDLYEKFIELQYNIYFKEKMESLDEYSQNVLINAYKKGYGFLALNALFPTDQLYTQFLTKNKIYSENKFVDTLSRIGFLKNYEDNHMINFIHRTYAEYFVAILSINILKKSTNHYKYKKKIQTFLLRHIFLDCNKLIYTFLNEIQEKHNNYDIKVKWKTIQKCDLLKEIETKRMLILFNSTSFKNNTTSTDAIFKKTLSESKKEVELCMNRFTVRYYRGNNIYYDADVIYQFNGNKNLVKQLFRKFLEETDIKELEIAVEFLVKTRWNFSNNMRYHDKIINKMDDTFLELMYQKYIVINHYLVQAKLQNKSSVEVDKMISDLKEDILPTERETIEHFMALLNEFIKVKNSQNEAQREKYLENLVLVIPNHKYHAGDFKILNNNIYYLFNKCDQSAINDIKSSKKLQEIFKERIMHFLENTHCPVWEGQLSDALPNADIKYLQSLFIDVTHHSTIIADTKSSINEIYLRRKNDFCWLGREGVLMSRFLKILTPEMSEVFISVLKYSDLKYYSFGVFYDFIIYITDIWKPDKLPHIDKLAFFKMIAHFANIVVKIVECLRFTSNQLKTTLQLLKSVLNEHSPDQTQEVLENIVKYLLTLKMAGLKLININDRKILILDPASEFQFELSTNYKNQIIELMESTYVTIINRNI